MQPRTIQFTPEGYQKLKNDLEIFTKRRVTAVNSLRTAREMGDLSENGAYKAARFELSFVDQELRRLKFLLRFGKIGTVVNSGRVGFGNRVTLVNGKDELTFTLVDGFESNPQQEKLSILSPIGKAVLGKTVGETVTVTSPSGMVHYTMREIT